MKINEFCLTFVKDDSCKGKQKENNSRLFAENWG